MRPIAGAERDGDRTLGARSAVGSASQPVAGRNDDAVIWDQSNGQWAVRTRELALHMMRDRHLAVVQRPELATPHVPGPDEELSVAEFFGSWFSRNQRHAQVRRELNPAFTAVTTRRLEGLFRQAALDCHVRLSREGDLMTEYFTPYGILTTARMLDVPDSEMENITKVIHLVTAFVKKPLSKNFAAAESEVRAMRLAIRYLRGLVEYLFRLPAPGPVVQALKRLVVAEGASVWLAVTTIGQLLVAGVEPMTNGAGLACLEIFTRPTMRHAIESGKIGMAQVVEESLRLAPPFLFVHRWAQKSCDCLGVRISPGDHVVVDMRAVNRDPAVFDEPDAFRPDRPRHQPLTFGRGPHTCLGMHSGRLQIAVALETLLEQEPRIEIDRARSRVSDLAYLICVPSIPFQRPRNGEQSSASIG
jgi:cytochrome P450